VISFKGHRESRPRQRLVTLPSIVLCATVVSLVAGAVAVWLWQTTGNSKWVQEFFQYPGALFLVGASAFEVALCFQCLRGFSVGEPLAGAWLLLFVAAACHFTGSVISEVLGAASRLNPIAWWRPGAPPEIFAEVRALGLTLGGPVRWLFLACGLFLVLRVYRRTGLLGRFRQTDWLLVMGTVTYLLLETGSVIVALRTGKVFSLRQQIDWFNDPLLLVLMIEAILIYRSLVASGLGLVTRCWGAYMLAIAFTHLGDLGLFAHAYGYAPWPVQAITWHIWFIASGLFALAPAYQMEAVRRIRLSVKAVALRRTNLYAPLRNMTAPWSGSSLVR